MTLLDNVEICYEGGLFYKITSGSFGYHVRDVLREMLEKALQKELVLDASIKKDLGYYKIQNYKRASRKNFKYIETENGYKMLIGSYYQLFSASKSYRQYRWLFNNSSDGGVIFEITPSYPCFFTTPEEGEVVIKYSEWLKNYRPYVVRTIATETIEKWMKQLDELIYKVVLTMSV